MTAVLDPAAVQAAAGAPPAKGRRKLILIALVVVVAAAGAAFVLLRPSEAEAGPPPPPPEGTVLEVTTMTSGLAGPKVHYAKLGFALVLVEGADEAAVQAKYPLLRDAVISELATFDAATLRTSEGMEQLRGRLTDRARAIFAEHDTQPVSRVVLTELVVQ